MNRDDRERLERAIRGAMETGTDWLNRKMEDMNQKKQYSDPNIVEEAEPPQLYARRLGKAAGISLTAVGFSLGGICLLGALGLLGGMMLMGEPTLGMILSLLLFLPAGGFGFMAYKGMSMLSRANRFQNYVRTIGQDELCNIKLLAQKAGKKEKYVVKDIEKMIQKGWFCQGHLDDRKTCLMVTDSMYREYRKLEDERARHLLEEKERQKRAQAEAKRKMAEDAAKAEEKQKKGSRRRNLAPEVKKVIEQGDMYVLKIRECNDAIPGEVISAKIDRMEILVDKIFDRVEQKPSTVGDIRKLIEYYLPTTIKLLETYTEIDSQPVGGENIRAAKKEIEDAIDTINTAFEKLLDSLFQDTAWDVSSDISVLNTMLAQEGLMEDGLKK